MTNSTFPSPPTPSRLTAPGVIIALFALVMSGCVLGLVAWKSAGSRDDVLASNKIDIQNLAHSLAEQTSNAILSADLAMGGVADLLKYQTPQRSRLDAYLAGLAEALPQIRELGVLDADGNWIYSSLPSLPPDNAGRQNYFVYHRDTPFTPLRISRPAGTAPGARSAIVLSKRVSTIDGGFKGVLIATIDNGYFEKFFSTLKLGSNGSISVIRRDGVVLIQWPSGKNGHDLGRSNLFQKWLPRDPIGYQEVTSPFDGVGKYLGYEATSLYPLVVTVAKSKYDVLADWRSTLRSDLAVALALLCTTLLLTSLLAAQFRRRIATEQTLRERETRYRLLADNIADIVVLLDRHGKCLFVSQSIEQVLGLKPADLVGVSCYSLVHPDDLPAIGDLTAQLTSRTVTKTATFRTWRSDGSLAWMEINFKLTDRDIARDPEVVGVLRDVSTRKAMEEELTSLNYRLVELATTDGLTGLANRRTFDEFFGREYGRHDTISVLLFDIDNFKGFNDTLGHQAGDRCLREVARVIAEATANTPGISARYGGEEFAIVLPRTVPERAMIVAEAIRLKVRALGLENPASSRGYVTVSVGIAGKQPGMSGESRLLREADLALYEAKHGGRNRCVLRGGALPDIPGAGPLQPMEPDEAPRWSRLSG